MKRLATIQTLDDVAKAIKSFGDVEVRPGDEPSSVKILAWPFVISVKQHETLFHWTLQAIDDPSDSDEGFAADPLDEILDSLSEETPGRDIWKQYAASPAKLSALLRKLASNPTDRKSIVLLKRIAGFLSAAEARPNLLLDLHQREIQKIVRSMETRHWRASEVQDESGLPAVEFEIGEAYEGKIMLSKILYEYEFSVEKQPAVTEDGVTDDVVGHLKAWLHKPDVDEAAAEAERLDSEETLRPQRPGTDTPTGRD